MPVQTELLEILACPDCTGHLQAGDSELICADCKRKFQIQNDIPLLYPKNQDISGFREKILLAEIEKQSRTGEQAEYDAIQWKQSKQEFWKIVQKKIGKPPKRILYIGAGYDPGFQPFQENGHLFINLDLVSDKLETLKNEHKAEYCIAGDMHALPFQKQCFDAFIIIDLLQYERDLKSILQNMMHFLKPEGQFFLRAINAWALFRFFKPIVMPRMMYSLIHKIHDRYKKKHHWRYRYQFPTSYWNIRQHLAQLGCSNIQVFPIDSYPGLNQINRTIYHLLSLIKAVPIYLNYHYMLSAENNHNSSFNEVLKRVNSFDFDNAKKPS
ncbi:methyltransferase domain-containing protein [bacterium]|nr:methyltransferase domain-containing protein [bacterium]